MSVVLDESKKARSSDMPKAPAADTQEMSTFFVQKLWPQGPTSEIIGNSASLQPNGEPTVSWCVCRHMEGQILRPGCSSQGVESVLKGSCRAD